MYIYVETMHNSTPRNVDVVDIRLLEKWDTRLSTCVYQEFDS